jgi:hypothetical protein
MGRWWVPGAEFGQGITAWLGLPPPPPNLPNPHQAVRQKIALAFVYSRYFLQYCSGERFAVHEMSLFGVHYNLIHLCVCDNVMQDYPLFTNQPLW